MREEERWGESFAKVVRGKVRDGGPTAGAEAEVGLGAAIEWCGFGLFGIYGGGRLCVFVGRAVGRLAVLVLCLVSTR